MTVAAGMKAVSETGREGELVLRATHKVISVARRRSGKYWTFQLLRVMGGTKGRCFFRHNVLKEEWERRFLITARKLELWHARKQTNWRHLNVRREDYKSLGNSADAGSGAPCGSGRGQWS